MWFWMRLEVRVDDGHVGDEAQGECKKEQEGHVIHNLNKISFRREVRFDKLHQKCEED